jgi:probable phosphoglycerate mutase
MTEFLIVRHGQTPWNTERRIQGWRDIELNRTGITQARRLAAHLGQPEHPLRPLHALYSSDLLRARQTAQALAQTLQMPLNLLEGVRERNYGILEGVPFDEMGQRLPEVAQIWHSRDPDGVIPEGETLREFTTRVTDALQSLAAQHSGQRVIVVTHGGAMDIIWRLATRTPIEIPRKALLLNASINRITIKAAGDGFEWSLLEWGNVDHLEGSDSDVTAQ